MTLQSLSRLTDPVNQLSSLVGNSLLCEPIYCSSRLTDASVLSV